MSTLNVVYIAISSMHYLMWLDMYSTCIELNIENFNFSILCVHFLRPWLAKRQFKKLQTSPN